MGLETISEPAFLLTELRYTLGQITVQTASLDPATRGEPVCDGKSVNAILQEMLEREGEFERRCSQLVSGGERSGDEAESPLPLSRGESTGGPEVAFEAARGRTLALLSSAGDAWPAELLRLVKERAAEDRQATTALAECRRAHLDRQHEQEASPPLTRPQDDASA